MLNSIVDSIMLLLLMLELFFFLSSILNITYAHGHHRYHNCVEISSFWPVIRPQGNRLQLLLLD